MRTTQELRDMTVDGLQAELLDMRRQQFKLRMERANGVLEKTHPFRIIRRSIARIKTIMTEKERVS